MIARSPPRPTSQCASQPLLSTRPALCTGDGILGRVLDAFAAWLQQGVTSRMEGAVLAQNPLVLAALHGLQVRCCDDGVMEKWLQQV